MGAGQSSSPLTRDGPTAEGRMTYRMHHLVEGRAGSVTDVEIEQTLVPSREAPRAKLYCGPRFRQV
jgi:hypothetical protein